MIKNFLDLFDPIQKGDFGLTDEAIYKSLQQAGTLIPVYGAYQTHSNPFRFVPAESRTKYDEPITIFTGKGIIINFDGASAGRMTYKRNEIFALNHHTGFFRVRKDAIDAIVPEFFALFYQKQLQEASVSSDQKTLTSDIIYSMEFDIPSHDVQKKIMFLLKPILEKKRELDGMLENINSIKSRVLSYDYSNYQAKGIQIKEILECMNGNSGLTESEIYQKIRIEGPRYKVLSSSTQEDTLLGEIPQCLVNGKPLKIFEDKEGLLVIRNGKAGKTFFLERGKYTINDHAYILSTNENVDYEVSLRWLMIQYGKLFFEYSSSSDNGTWNKTGFFRDVNIDLPLHSDQVQVVDVYGKLEDLERRIKTIINKIEAMFSRQVAS